mmetsp:Transcript_12068/g.28339  ORF Transcript_12068/g.28339 Transcript_12068/m.28339 type:complete len:192 (+) Transcript_12068:74-649(+)
MFSFFSFFGAGVAAQRRIADCVPCRASCPAGGAFKLTVWIHTVSLDEQNDRKPAVSKRPWVEVAIGRKTKQTEPGDWRSEDERWHFEESITSEVTAKDEALISVMCSQQYNLGIAALALSDNKLGELCIHVASVLPQLQAEEREFEGVLYTTPKISFDFHKDGAKVGRMVLSFRSKQPPPGYEEGEIVTQR